jgi:aryl-alcohol dehydrogenase-like predicted oxidoreductase
MRYRRLGDSGLAVSVVGLGCNNFGRRIDATATKEVVDAALEAGITLFDTAEALERYAEERGLSILDVAVGGLAAQPGVASVIAGTTKPEQAKANAAAGLWVPTADDLAALDAIAPTPRKES